MVITFQYAIKSPEEKAKEEAAAAASDRTGQIGVPPGLQNMADEEAADDSKQKFNIFDPLSPTWIYF